MPLEITFLGHAGFLLDDGSHPLLVDPFLTGNPLAVHDPGAIDCTHIALTHGHEDHVGDTAAIARRTGATVIGAFELCNLLGEKGLEQLEPGNPGGRITTPFGSVVFTQAFHSSSYEGRYTGMPCGLVIEMAGKRFYHAGDTALFSDMKLIGERYRPDVSAIPIGDRFTMDAESGARAAEWVGAPVTIPIHYRTFPLLAPTAEGFAPEGIEVKELAPGESFQA